MSVVTIITFSADCATNPPQSMPEFEGQIFLGIGLVIRLLLIPPSDFNVGTNGKRKGCVVILKFDFVVQIPNLQYVTVNGQRGLIMTTHQLLVIGKLSYHVILLQRLMQEKLRPSRTILYLEILFI